MSDYTKLVEQLKDYSSCRKGEIAELTADAAAAIEALLKENKELIEDHPEMVEADGHWAWRKPNGEVLMPKRGKWINSKERMRPDMCSVCGCVYEADRFMDKIAWNYCPNCGAKMGGTDASRPD